MIFKAVVLNEITKGVDRKWQEKTFEDSNFINSQSRTQTSLTVKHEIIRISPNPVYCGRVPGFLMLRGGQGESLVMWMVNL